MKTIACPKGHVNVRETGVTRLSSAGGTMRVNGHEFPMRAVNVVTYYYICKTCKAQFKVIEQAVKQ